VGVAGLEREVGVELVAAEDRERGVLVVVAALVDQGLAGADAGVEAGVLGLGGERDGAGQQGGEGGGKQLGTHGYLLMWGKRVLRRRASRGAAAASSGDGCFKLTANVSFLDSLSHLRDNRAGTRR